MRTRSQRSLNPIQVLPRQTLTGAEKLEFSLQRQTVLVLGSSKSVECFYMCSVLQGLDIQFGDTTHSAYSTSVEASGYELQVVSTVFVHTPGVAAVQFG